MLYSQGIRLEQLGIPARDGSRAETDPRAVWRIFAEHYHLFRGTPTRIWLDHVFATLFGFTERLSAATADAYYDRISESLGQPEFRPRALFGRFNIEVIATTESPLDPLAHHRAIRESGWNGRVVTAYRPDPVVDPDFEGFREQHRALRGADRLRYAVLVRLSRGASQAPRVLPRVRSDLDRPRPSERGDRQPFDSGGGSAVRPHPRRRFHAGGGGAVPRADADRDGGDEPGRRNGDAAPSRIAAQPQRRALRPLRPRHGGRHPDAHRLCARAEAAARPLRRRDGADADPLHARRDILRPRARAARRPLSVPEARAALVVLRQSRRDAALPRADDGDGGLLQHRRLQRRHARLSLDPRAPRHGAARRLRFPGRAGGGASAWARTRRTKSRTTSPIGWPRKRTSCERGGRGRAGDAAARRCFACRAAGFGRASGLRPRAPSRPASCIWASAPSTGRTRPSTPTASSRRIQAGASWRRVCGAPPRATRSRRRTGSTRSRSARAKARSSASSGRSAASWSCRRSARRCLRRWRIRGCASSRSPSPRRAIATTRRRAS